MKNPERGGSRLGFFTRGGVTASSSLLFRQGAKASEGVYGRLFSRMLPGPAGGGPDGSEKDRVEAGAGSRLFKPRISSSMTSSRSFRFREISAHHLPIDLLFLLQDGREFGPAEVCPGHARKSRFHFLDPVPVLDPPAWRDRPAVRSDPPGNR